jgi:hypothetical protein
MKAKLILCLMIQTFFVQLFSLGHGDEPSRVPLLYKTGYIIPCTDIIEEKSFISTFEFPNKGHSNKRLCSDKSKSTNIPLSTAVTHSPVSVM